MRPDRVIFSPVPRRLRSGIRHILEFHSLQKLVAQATVKRFDVSILPRASRGYGKRLAPTAGSQFTNASQMNSEPLSLLIRVGAPRRPITRATIRRTSAPAIDVAACSTKHSRVYSSTSVSHLSGRPLGCPIVDEVASPDIVLEPGRLIDAAIGAGPRFRAEFPGFSQPHRPLQPQLDPEPPHAFDIDRPPSPQQQGVNHAVPETRMSTRQPFDLPIQGRLIGAAHPTVSQYRARPAQDAADSPLREIVLFAK